MRQAKQLPGKEYPVDKHFNRPSYNPWEFSDSSFCGYLTEDFFHEHFNKRSSPCRNGENCTFSEKAAANEKTGDFIEQKTIVLATGLKIQFLLGGASGISGSRIIKWQKSSDSLLYL